MSEWMDFDPKKLPWYWKRFSRLQPLWCSFGWHVPVMAEHTDSKDNEYFCQECVKEVTRADWIKFFREAKKNVHP